jgi:hypothetical protein
VADVFRHFGVAFRDQHGASLSGARRRAMIAIENCRTAALGGHVERCGDCGHQRIAYDSCRNRNCPKCQGLARARWLADRQAELGSIRISGVSTVRSSAGHLELVGPERSTPEILMLSTSSAWVSLSPAALPTASFEGVAS